MARDHARIYVAIWNDPDWRALDQAAQHTYWLLMSQPRLSYCGVIDYFPKRLAVLTAGVTEAKIKAAVRVLERARFVVVDRETHELLVRSYVRHDGVMARVNMGKATARALTNVISEPIRDAILGELARLWLMDNTLAGWIGFKEESPMAYEMALAMASTMPSEVSA